MLKQKIDKGKFLGETIEHIDIKQHDTRALVNAMSKMSFSARDLARASEIYELMLQNKNCTVFLTIAGSTSAAGCMQIYVDMVKNNMVDAVVTTGATVIDMDFFEAVGNKHYRGSPDADNVELRKHLVDRIYDTYIDEEALEASDMTIKEIANSLPRRNYASWEFLNEVGKWLAEHPERAPKKDSLLQTAYEHGVPVFCPGIADSGGGFGLAHHYLENPDNHIVVDPILDFNDITNVKINTKETGLIMIGGGVPKNFTQDIVIAAEMQLGKEVAMHKYAVQITVADVRDGALSSSTLKEAGSWGKVNNAFEQMVFAEATTVLPLFAGYAYHSRSWEQRNKARLTDKIRDFRS